MKQCFGIGRHDWATCSTGKQLPWKAFLAASLLLPWHFGYYANILTETYPTLVCIYGVGGQYQRNHLRSFKDSVDVSSLGLTAFGFWWQVYRADVAIAD